MSRLVGYFMFAVAAFCLWLTWHKASVMSALAEAGIQRNGAGFELLILALLGIVIPLGIGALLLRKQSKN